VRTQNVRTEKVISRMRDFENAWKWAQTEVFFYHWPEPLSMSMSTPTG